MPAASLCKAAKCTCLEPTDIVEAVEIPSVPENTFGSYARLARTRRDIAKLTVAVNLCMDGDTCSDARIVVGAAAPVIFRAKAAEDILRGRKLAQKRLKEAAAAARDDPSTTPISDIRSTADYRKKMVGVLVERALKTAAAKAAKA